MSASLKKLYVAPIVTVLKKEEINTIQANMSYGGPDGENEKGYYEIVYDGETYSEIDTYGLTYDVLAAVIGAKIAQAVGKSSIPGAVISVLINRIITSSLPKVYCKMKVWRCKYTTYTGFPSYVGHRVEAKYYNDPACYNHIETVNYTVGTYRSS